MKPSVKLIGLGLLAFIVFLLVTAPAKLLTKPLSAYTPIQFEQVAGSVWNGRAQQLRIQRIPIGSVGWRISPWKLFSGRLATILVIGAGQADPDLSGTIEFSLQPPGKLEIQHAKLQAKAEWVVTQAAIPIVPTGDVQFDIDHLLWRPGELPHIAAKIAWQNAGVSYPDHYALGAYHADLQHQPADNPDRIVGHIRDSNSPLHVNGTVELDAGSQYAVDINISAESYAPADIARVLPLLGRRQADGSVKIVRKGSLHSLL